MADDVAARMRRRAARSGRGLAAPGRFGAAGRGARSSSRIDPRSPATGDGQPSFGPSWVALTTRALALLDGDDEDALRQALVAFDDLGAAATARVTRQKMRALGIRSIPSGRRSSTRAHPLGLTQREREVLELICDGFTNSEIAG